MNPKDILIVTLLLIITAILSAGGVYLYFQHQPAPTATPTATIQTSPTPQTPSNPTPPQPTTENQQPTPTPSSDTDLITQAMADKYAKSLADTDLTVEENTGKYAKGLVRFAGEISGGWWLAYKSANTWEIIADGNGTVTCTDIEPYNFPTDLVPECFDSITNTLITR